MSSYTFKSSNYNNFNGGFAHANFDFVRYFDTRKRMSPGTLKREVEEQVALFLDMRKHDMIVKLTKGEFSFSVVPDEHMSSRKLAERNDLTYFECVSHLQHMEKSGILDFYSQDRISLTFFGQFDDLENKIDSFAAFSNHQRAAFSELTTEQAETLVRNTLTNHEILTVELRSPGVSIYQYD